MHDHLDAIRTKLGASYPVDLWQPSPGRVPQFGVIEAPAWASDPDAPIGETSSAFEVEVRFRAVAGTPQGVAIMLAAARAAIPGSVTVSGRAVTARWARSEFIMLDLDVIIPATNRHPAYGVDSYTIHSQPAGQPARVVPAPGVV